MAKKSIFTENQARRCHKLYFIENRKASEIATILNAEYEKEGLKVTPRQVSEYGSTRNWPEKKKAQETRGAEKAGQLITQAAQKLAETKLAALAKHKDFIDLSVQIGGKVMQKASTLIDNTNSARDLSSAANAAAKGIEIYRKAVGLDENGSGGGGGPTNINFYNFARGADSPFTKQAQPVTEAEVHDLGELEPKEGEPKEDTPAFPEVNTLVSPRVSEHSA